MALNISPDFFQMMLSNLFADLPFVHCCIDDTAIAADGSCEDHLAKTEIDLQRLEEHGLQVNGKKSDFAKK